MDDRRRDDLTPGDPLGPEAPAQVAGGDPFGREVPAGDPFGREGRAAEHYGSGPVPPGAFSPRERRPGPPSPDQLAEWWRRVVATIVDGVLVGAITVVLLAVLGIGLFADGDLTWLEVVGGAILAVVVFAGLGLFYAPVMMARTDGQTLGRMLAGCRVVRADGGPVGFWWAALREVGVKWLLVGIATAVTGGIAYFADVLWPLWDSQNRALHDYVVDSRVVKA